jgi:predicted methyltransferase
MRAFRIAALLLVAASPLLAKPAASTDTIAAAVASPDRSPDNVKLDESRKPAEVLKFLGLRPGMRVADPFGGNFYWAEITGRAVGPKGHVTVWQPQQFYTQKVADAYQAVQAKQPNVWMRVSPMESPDIPAGKYDFMLINLDYHDVYWENAKRGIPRMDPDQWLKTIYAAMKPGAIVGIIDHVANPNSDARATVDKLHRIDPNIIKADFKRAGFQLVGSSDMLRNPADDHSLLVFDPKIRGKTDRVVLKFRKPH